MKIRALFITAAAALLPLSFAFNGAGSKGEGKVTAESALAELKAGNRRHVAHRHQHPHESAERQRELVSGQHPHAEILSCSDSRVPPELVFDQGLGDLFVVRVAGNVAADIELASLEYGAEHLHVPLLVVLGHRKCGAVTAAVEEVRAEGHLGAVFVLLRPAVEKTRGMSGDPVENAVKANVEATVRQLRASTPVLARLVSQGKLKVVGGVYSLDTGEVVWLPDSP